MLSYPDVTPPPPRKFKIKSTEILLSVSCIHEKIHTTCTLCLTDTFPRRCRQARRTTSKARSALRRAEPGPRNDFDPKGSIPPAGAPLSGTRNSAVTHRPTANPKTPGEKLRHRSHPLRPIPVSNRHRQPPRTEGAEARKRRPREAPAAAEPTTRRPQRRLPARPPPAEPGRPRRCPRPRGAESQPRPAPAARPKAPTEGSSAPRRPLPGQSGGGEGGRGPPAGPSALSCHPPTPLPVTSAPGRHGPLKPARQGDR